MQATTIKSLGDAPHPAASLRAIGYADVRSGILPARSGHRFATVSAEAVPDSIRELQTPMAAHSASAMDAASIPG